MKKKFKFGDQAYLIELSGEARSNRYKIGDIVVIVDCGLPEKYDTEIVKFMSLHGDRASMCCAYRLRKILNCPEYMK